MCGWHSNSDPLYVPVPTAPPLPRSQTLLPHRIDGLSRLLQINVLTHRYRFRSPTRIRPSGLVPRESFDGAYAGGRAVAVPAGAAHELVHAELEVARCGSEDRVPAVVVGGAREE